uniref:Uncharacterized protein n=1 Tax=viral metagenome TaxID=1070528 RepID=A0A6M3IDU2_9ZZZZ
MNIYLSDDGIYNSYAAAPNVYRSYQERVIMKASANHAVKEVYDYLNVKDLKVMVNRLLEVGLMIKEMDDE